MAEQQKIKIAFLSTSPLENKRHWSGTIFNMYQALLAQGFEIEWIPVGDYTPGQQKLFVGTEKLHKAVFNRGFNKNHFFIKAWIASKKVQKRLRNSDADLIFAPTYIAELAFLKTTKPIIYLNDATFHQLLNYYGGMSGFGLLSKKTTVAIERKALKNADQLIFSSDWAAYHAIHFYKIQPEKIHVIKFGSNSAAPAAIQTKDYKEGITFLFLGVDWERKGGDIALRTIQLLHQKGFRVKLLVVGCTPPIEDPNLMEVIPFLNKNNPSEAQKITEILANSHFLFMPTRADCTPISFCEAASYGLPVISTYTGGVSAHVEPQKTGLLLPLEAGPEQYASALENLLRNPQEVTQMSKAARQKYETELNWEVWSGKMPAIIHAALG